jgi:hypothetical protein
MTDRPAPAPPKDPRKQKLAAALKANIARRKEQARERDAQTDATEKEGS